MEPRADEASQKPAVPPGTTLLVVQPQDASVSQPLTCGPVSIAGSPAPLPHPAKGPPQLFGDFELLTAGKEGGMGVVYQARQISLNRIVALKMIRAGSFAGEKEVQRFRAEAEAAASLDHPHIVPIYEVGELEGRHYFTMKWIDGHSLAEAEVESLTSQELRAAAALMAKTASAVQHAHERGILHRDLKPGNILIDRQGEPHVTDFGLAKRIESNVEMTATGVVMGTPSYMSPEQAQGNNKELTTASDIFSLGAILYRLITARTPFTGDSAFEIIRHVIESEPARPAAVNPKIDRDLESICLRCLEKEPKRRYASAEALAADLRSWLEGRPVEARPVSDWERRWKWVRRHPAISILSSAIAISILLGLAGVTWQWQRAERQRAITAHANLRLELQRAEDLFAADKGHLALAALSRMVRDNPNDRTAAERLVNALSQRAFFLPAPLPPEGLTNQDVLARGSAHQAAISLSPTEGERAGERGPMDDTARMRSTLNSLTSEVLIRITNAHTAPIRHMALSPDRMRIVTASADGTAKVHDAQSGRLLYTLPHHAAVYWAEFSPDGSKIVTGTAAPDAEARIWDAATGAPTSAEPMRHLRAVNSARFGPDPGGLTVITASDDGTVRLWESASGKQISEPLVATQAVDDARFVAGGRLILATFENGEQRTYRITPGTILLTAGESDIPTRPAVDARTATLAGFKRQLLSRHAGEITSLDICSNLNLLASASTDKSARMWDARTLQPLAPPLLHEATVNCVRFSADGLRLATSTAQPTRVRLWDTGTGQPLSDWIQSPDPVAALEFSPDGSWLFSSAGWKWKLYPIAAAAPAWLPELAEAIARVRYTATGLSETVPETTFLNLQASLQHSTNTNLLTECARKFLPTPK
jgi:WD40 repeat protein/tRNA A-37 threonylcarbamoyl transferase component Bud32